MPPPATGQTPRRSAFGSGYCAATLAVRSLISRQTTEAILSGASAGSASVTPAAVCSTFTFLWPANNQAFFTLLWSPAISNFPSVGHFKIARYIFPGLLVARQSQAGMNLGLPFWFFSVALNRAGFRAEWRGAGAVNRLAVDFHPRADFGKSFNAWLRNEAFAGRDRR